MSLSLPDKREHRNITIYLLFSAMYGVAVNLRGGLHTGLPALAGLRHERHPQLRHRRAGGVHRGVPAVCAALLRAGGHEKNQRRSGFVHGIFPAALAGARAWKFPSLAALQIVILCAAALHGFLTAARATAEFTITPRPFARGRYGSVAGKASVIGGVIPVCISLGAGFLLGQESSGTYPFLFGLCAAAFALAALFACLYRLGEAPGETMQHVPLRVLAKTVAAPGYLKVLMPHFLRGIGMAGMYYIVPSALKNVSLSKSEETFLIVIPVAATVAGSFLFMLLSKQANTGAVTFASALACSLLMPPLVLLTGKAAFLSLYFVFFVCNMITQLSIPTGVLRSHWTAGLR